MKQAVAGKNAGAGKRATAGKQAAAGKQRVEPKEARRLKDLAGVGPRTLEDFRDLGIGGVDALAQQNPQELYERLSRQKGVRMDPCVLDTFTCAIAQAKDPQLPADQCNWWYWSRVRKGQIPAPTKRQAPAGRGR